MPGLLDQHLRVALEGEGAQFRLTLPRRLSQPLRHSPLPLVPTDTLESA